MPAAPEHRLTYLVSRDYARRTGGWIYNERLLAELAGRGWAIERRLLAEGFPAPSAAARADAAAIYAALPDGALALTDQICLSPIPEIAQAHATRLKLSMIVHHPLAEEHDRGGALAQAMRAGERAALGAARAIIVTSNATAATLRTAYGVNDERLSIAPPGLDPHPRSSRSSDPPLLLSVGAVVPRKGHDRLIAGLAPLAHLSWRLVIAGNLDRAPDHVARLRAAVAAAGLDARVRFVDEIDDEALQNLWNDAALYVAAPRLEGYGMAVAEALARGLPVVATHATATGDWLARDAALVVADGDVASLREALARALTDAALRNRLSEAAHTFAQTLPRWSDTAVIVDRALSQVY